MNDVNYVLSVITERCVNGTAAPVTLTIGKEFSSTFVKVHNAPNTVVKRLVADFEFVSMQEDGLYIPVKP